MTAEQETKDVLFASAVLLAMVGQNARGTYKIYPEEIPEDDALPAVTYERADSQPEYLLDNTLAASRISISITVWAKTRTEANAIALQITNLMHVAGHAQTSAGSSFEPELDEYAAVRSFDVWEL